MEIQKGCGRIQTATREEREGTGSGRQYLERGGRKAKNFRKGFLGMEGKERGGTAGATPEQKTEANGTGEKARRRGQN
ncbi:hypothetical protein AHF37_05973 [Paragonimus kellicotti]|nr:hypothetical protein AHF37_05973 [Paragonimus kellicotti]